VFREHAGPIILRVPSVPRQRRGASEFHARLDRFLGALPREFECAVELRDASLLTPAYRAIVARHGVAHTYNYWSAMPMPVAQAAVVPRTRFLGHPSPAAAGHVVGISGTGSSRSTTSWSRTRPCVPDG
jgi:hypothetical protein